MKNKNLRTFEAEILKIIKNVQPESQTAHILIKREYLPQPAPVSFYSLSLKSRGGGGGGGTPILDLTGMLVVTFRG